MHGKNLFDYAIMLAGHLVLFPVGMALLLQLLDTDLLFANEQALIHLSIIQLGLAVYASEEIHSKQLNRLLLGVWACCVLIASWAASQLSNDAVLVRLLFIYTAAAWVCGQWLWTWKPTVTQQRQHYSIPYQILNVVIAGVELYFLVQELAKLLLYTSIMGWSVFDFSLGVPTMFVILQLMLLRFLSSVFYDEQLHKPVLFEVWRIGTAAFLFYTYSSNHSEAAWLYQVQSFIYSNMIWNRFEWQRGH